MTLKLNGTNSVAAPAYAGDDADTGLQCGTDELKLVTGGTARLTVASSGKVGIGIDSPGQNLTIKRTGGQTQVSLISDTDQTGAIYFGDTASTARGVIEYDHTGDFFRFYTSGSERARILSGGGLTFNGDTAQANALDDYEEGTWTPTAASGASGFTVTAANCIYTKVGDLVTLHFEVYNPTSVTSSAFKIGGLPYQIASNVQVIGSVMVQNVDFPTNRTMITMYGFSNEFRFYGLGDTQSWELLDGNEITTSGFIIGTVSYRVA